jgi:hypothetical protein
MFRIVEAARPRPGSTGQRFQRTEQIVKAIEKLRTAVGRGDVTRLGAATEAPPPPPLCVIPLEFTCPMAPGPYVIVCRTGKFATGPDQPGSAGFGTCAHYIVLLFRLAEIRSNRVVNAGCFYKILLFPILFQRACRSPATAAAAGPTKKTVYADGALFF